MPEYIRLSPRIRISDSTIHPRPDKFTFKFDDLPGTSNGRVKIPIMNGQEKIAEDLYNKLKEKVEKLGVGGVHSKALTGETYSILLFALSGVGGGVLGAIGRDIWNKIKKACAKILHSRSAKRNMLEVAIKFQDFDVLLHFENRTAKYLPDVLDEADSILVELKDAMNVNLHTFVSVKAIELRKIRGKSGFECVLHSYRKGDDILKDLTKQSRKKKGAIKRPKKKKKTKAK